MNPNISNQLICGETYLTQSKYVYVILPQYIGCIINAVALNENTTNIAKIVP